MASSKEMRKLARQAAKDGFDVTVTHGGHYKIRAKSGAFTIIPFSPGTARSEWLAHRTYRKFKERHGRP